MAGICPDCFSKNVTPSACSDCGKAIVPHANDVVLSPGIVVSQRYMVGRVLGQGGFGATYLGMDTKLSARIAVKEYLPYGCVVRAGDGVSLRVNPSMTDSYRFGLARFLEEARMLARFRDCRAVVSVFDVFEENGSAYIIMELLQGQTLKQVIQATPNQRLPFAQVLTVINAVLGALTEIHRQNILHRDISPDNIMMDGDSTVKVLDFGAARQALSGYTQKLSIILKPGYAPFEQYLEDGKQGPWSDVYAAAATCYHAITGRKPVDALQRMSQDTLQRPSDLGVAVPPLVETALLKALALRVEDRFQSAAEFAAALGKTLEAGVVGGSAKDGRSASGSAVGGVSSANLTVTAAAPAVKVLPLRPASVPASPAAGFGAGVGVLAEHLAETPPGAGVHRTNEVGQGKEEGQRVDGRLVSAADLARMVREHGRFLKGQSNGRRLDLSFCRLSGLSLTGLNLQQSELRGALFRGSDLSGSNLREANLFCGDFTNAQLVSCNFQKADLRGARFEGANLTDAKLDGADCRDGVLFVQQRGGGLLDLQRERTARAASFNGAVLERSSFCAADLSGADFRKARAVETRFERANLAAADFAEAKVVGAVFAGANLEGTEFTLADLSMVDTSAPEFAKARIVRHLEDIETELRQKIIDHQLWVDSLSRKGKRLVMRDCNLSGLQMTGVNWSAAEFHGVDLQDIVLRQAKLSMVAFPGSRLDNADLSKVEACGANFSGCSMVGIDLSDADLSAVTSISDARTRWRSNFERADMRSAALARVRLNEGRLSRANLTGAVLAGASLRGADFTGANLTGADFTNADVTGANFGGATLARAKGLETQGR